MLLRFVENREVDRLSLVGWLLAATLGSHIIDVLQSRDAVYTIDIMTCVFDKRFARLEAKLSRGVCDGRLRKCWVSHTESALATWVWRRRLNNAVMVRNSTKRVTASCPKGSRFIVYKHTF